MNIGDKVRFLNDVGGGIVREIKSGGIAMVEDEDGFDIPCLVDDLVVIETNEHNIDIHKFDNLQLIERRRDNSFSISSKSATR